MLVFFSFGHEVLLNLNGEFCKAPRNQRMTAGNDSHLDKRITSNNIERIYSQFYGGARAQGRIYRNSNKEFITVHRGELIVVPDSFLIRVVEHIESALEQGYGEYLFFPDFGHGHLQAPQALSDVSLTYFFEGNDFSILYHSVEGYSGASQFRQRNRNFYGSSVFGEGVTPLYPKKGKTTVFNIPSYKRTHFGIYIKANKNGCFFIERRGEKHFFDLKI